MGSQGIGGPGDWGTVGPGDSPGRVANPGQFGVSNAVAPQPQPARRSTWRTSCPPWAALHTLCFMPSPHPVLSCPEAPVTSSAYQKRALVRLQGRHVKQTTQQPQEQPAGSGYITRSMRPSDASPSRLPHQRTLQAYVGHRVVPCDVCILHPACLTHVWNTGAKQKESIGLLTWRGYTQALLISVASSCGASGTE